jgi:beta-phosphoglucomutase-like phosphatase (HAD superfamily)
MTFKGIIFDFNGVLWLDTALQEEAWQQFVTELRGTPFSAEEMAIHIHGRTNQHTLEYVTGRALAGVELEELLQRKETIYRRLCLEQGSAFCLSPGAIPLLDFLVEHAIPHTIATASEKTNVAFFIQHLDLARWFDPALIVMDNGVRPGKPAPDIYLQAAQALGLAPASVCGGGGSPSGIAAAHVAGIGHIIALGPADTHEALRQRVGVHQ